MGLKKPIRLSYRWRLFIDLLAVVWLVIGGLSVWFYHAEQDYRVRSLEHQINRIIRGYLYCYEIDGNINDYNAFMDNYLEGSLFDGVMVSVYNENDSLLSHIGTILPPDLSEMSVDQEISTQDGSHQAIVHGQDASTLFQVKSMKSNDGNLMVNIGMPYTDDIDRALAINSSLWWIIAAITVAATLVVYLSTRALARNITVLRDFVRRARMGEEVKVPENLPHDELSEISRDIFDLYDERIEAVEKSEREHRIALHAVEEKARVKRQLTNNINHELKTPIGVIRGYLDTIHDNPEMDDNTRAHFLNRARENVERLCTLLNDVSTITRLDEGAESIPLSDVDMHDLLYGIENDVAASKIAGDMEFTYDVPLDCHVSGNNNLLQGVIMNLIKNSVIHSHGTQMRFHLVSESSKYYIFAFYDDGTGVPPEHLPRLFERFYRVDSGRSRKVGGTGLGLPIVKNTIQSLGGTVSVHNRSTGGLQFVFSLRKWEG